VSWCVVIACRRARRERLQRDARDVCCTVAAQVSVTPAVCACVRNFMLASALAP